MLYQQCSPLQPHLSLDATSFTGVGWQDVPVILTPRLPRSTSSSSTLPSPLHASLPAVSSGSLCSLASTHCTWDSDTRMDDNLCMAKRSGHCPPGFLPLAGPHPGALRLRCPLHSWLRELELGNQQARFCLQSPPRMGQGQEPVPQQRKPRQQVLFGRNEGMWWGEAGILPLSHLRWLRPCLTSPDAIHLPGGGSTEAVTPRPL